MEEGYIFPDIIFYAYINVSLYADSLFEVSLKVAAAATGNVLSFCIVVVQRIKTHNTHVQR